MSENNDTFIKVTNADIYKKLLDIEKAQAYTNGKVRVHTANISGLWAVAGVLVSIVIWILQQ